MPIWGMNSTAFCFELFSCVIKYAKAEVVYRLPTSIYIYIHPISSCICHTHTHTEYHIRICICICIVQDCEHFYLCFYFPSASLVAAASCPAPTFFAFFSFSSSASAKILFYLSGLFLCVNAKCEPFFLSFLFLSFFLVFFCASFAHFSQQTTRAEAAVEWVKGGQQSG